MYTYYYYYYYESKYQTGWDHIIFAEILCLDIRDQSHKHFPKVDEKDPN